MKIKIQKPTIEKTMLDELKALSLKVVGVTTVVSITPDKKEIKEAEVVVSDSLTTDEETAVKNYLASKGLQ